MSTKKITLPTHFIDLHLHLDGAITLDIAKVLAKLQNQTLPSSSDAELSKLLSIPPDCEDLNEYLRRFDLPISLLQTKESISEAFYLVQEKLIAQNVIYAELRFAPQSFMQRGLSQREVVEAALDGLSRSNLSSSIILCCMRGPRREKANLETVQLAKEYLTTQDALLPLILPVPKDCLRQVIIENYLHLHQSLMCHLHFMLEKPPGADSVAVRLRWVPAESVMVCAP